jgi:hypothetical protein
LLAGAIRARIPVLTPPYRVTAFETHQQLNFTSDFSRFRIENMSDCVSIDEDVDLTSLTRPPARRIPAFGCTYTSTVSELCKDFELSGKFERDVTRSPFPWTTAVGELAFRLAPSDRPLAPSIASSSTSLHATSSESGRAPVASVESAHFSMPELESDVAQPFWPHPRVPPGHSVVPATNVFDTSMHMSQRVPLPHPGHVLSSHPAQVPQFPFQFSGGPWPPRPTGPQ